MLSLLHSQPCQAPVIPLQRGSKQFQGSLMSPRCDRHRAHPALPSAPH